MSLVERYCNVAVMEESTIGGYNIIALLTNTRSHYQSKIHHTDGHYLSPAQACTQHACTMHMYMFINYYTQTCCSTCIIKCIVQFGFYQLSAKGLLCDQPAG